MQIAKYLGARVTGVCSTRSVDLVRRLGADHVIDYTEQDFTVGAARYDLAIQLGGTYSPVAVRKVLTPRGTLIQSFGDGSRWLGPVSNIVKAAALNAFVGQTLKTFTAKVTAEAPQTEAAAILADLDLATIVADVGPMLPGSHVSAMNAVPHHRPVPPGTSGTTWSSYWSVR